MYLLFDLSDLRELSKLTGMKMEKTKLTLSNPGYNNHELKGS